MYMFCIDKLFIYIKYKLYNKVSMQMCGKEKCREINEWGEKTKLYKVICCYTTYFFIKNEKNEYNNKYLLCDIRVNKSKNKVCVWKRYLVTLIIFF